MAPQRQTFVRCCQGLYLALFKIDFLSGSAGSRACQRGGETCCTRGSGVRSVWGRCSEWLRRRLYALRDVNNMRTRARLRSRQNSRWAF